jgi:hypothetical protein
MKHALAAVAVSVAALWLEPQPPTPPGQVTPHAHDRIPDALVGQRRHAGGCTIQNNNTGNVLPAEANGDALFKLLSAQDRCPENALIFRDLVQANGMRLRPAMVGNRGFNNPLPQGSFSFFEAITGSYGGQTLEPGDWFFGHFTAASIDNIALTAVLSPQQAATPNNLLLETVVWDPKKGWFNFYEIRGNGEGGIWFYRGDSVDILSDIQNLHRNYNPSQPIFMGPVDPNGNATSPRLRCSGCHMNGGPIMKELKAPHDSWWTKERPLDLGALRIAPEFKPILETVVPASDIAAWVKAGDEKLLASNSYWEKRSKSSTQEQLRPIFCEQEVNLDSDARPFSATAKTVLAPAGFFVDQRLVPGIDGVEIDKTLYTNALKLFQSQFQDYQTSASFASWVQPVNQIDADHAFETPVKSHSDMLVAAKMVSSGLIDEKFLYDVIGIDMTRPMFSAERCGLLQLVPGGTPGPDWKARLERNLTDSPLPAAKVLLASMKDPSRTPDYYRGKAKALLTMVQQNAATQPAVNGLVRLLAGRRIAVFRDQISQHPQGQIFEPSFRLIFPTMQLFGPDQQQIAYGGVPGQFWLNPATGAVELAK